MALLNKLFSSRKKTQKQGYVSFGKNDSVSWRPFSFNKEQVRVLLFRECDWRGRKLLFDSESVQKTHIENQPSKLRFGSKSKGDKKRSDSFVEVTNGYGYQYLKPNQDVTVMGEMIFGSVAMSFRGNSFKVHSMKSPERLMCTKVFQSPGASHRMKKVSDQSLEDSYSSSISSMSDGTVGFPSISSDLFSGKEGSGPLDVPNSEFRTKSQLSSLEVDSGFCGDTSFRSPSSLGSQGPWQNQMHNMNSRNSSGSVGGLSGGSLSSLRRRWLRSVSTSLDTTCSGSVGLLSSRNSSSSETSSSVGNGHRRTKLGLAIIITLSADDEKEMETFLLEHMAILESTMERLQLAVERAYLRKDTFVHLMMEGHEDLTQWLSGLFTAPRPHCPLWLGLGLAPAPLNDSLSTSFLHDLCQLIATLDTKANNFFISTLITAVLTHHLGWVSTVMPEKSASRNFSKASTASQAMDSLSRSHPYNALWAQLGDLYGAVSFPTKVSRTIVSSSNGRRADLLRKIISCLTYFIRCGAVERNSCAHVPVEMDHSGEVELQLSSYSPVGFESSVVSTTTLTDTVVESSLSDCRMVTAANLKQLKHIINCDTLKSVTAESVSSAEGACDITNNTYLQPENNETQKNFRRKNLETEFLKLEDVTQFSYRGNKDNMCSPAGTEWEHRDESNHNPFPVLTNSQLVLTESDLQSDIHFDRSLSTESSKTLTENSSVLALPNYGGIKRTTSYASKMSQVTATPEAFGSKLYTNISSVEILEDSVNNNSFLHPEVISDKVSRLCRVPTKALLYHLQPEIENSEIYIPKKESCERQLSSVDLLKRPTTHVTAPCSKLSISTAPDTERTFASVDECNVNSESVNEKEECVIFVLGENEELVGVKSKEKVEVSDEFETLNLCNKEACGPCVDKNGNIRSVADRSSISSHCNKTVRENGVTDSNNVLYSDREESAPLNLKENSVNVEFGKQKCQFSINKCNFNASHGHEMHSFKCKCKDRVSTVMHKNNVCTRSAVDITDRSDFDTHSKLFHSERTDLIGSNSVGKVVTVHSSYIELEDEDDCKENRRTSFSKRSKPVVRSQSLSFPLCKKSSSKESSICRRHSEYVHTSERYLKNYHSVRFNFERCGGVLNNYVDGTGEEKFPEPDEISGARDNFEQQDNLSKNHPGEYCKCENELSSSHATNYVESECSDCRTYKTVVSDDLQCSKSRAVHVDTDMEREGNALFDEYSALSDEDVATSTAANNKDSRFEGDDLDANSKKTYLELPMPDNDCGSMTALLPGSGLAASLLGGVSDHYVPDLVLQGCMQPPRLWESALRRDLALSARHPPIDQDVAEAVCIVANTDSWDVQLLSSHAYVTDRPGMMGIHIGMSQLVANMLESLLLLWRLHVPASQCIQHLESKLRELYLRSQAVAEMLLSTDFCDVATLTAALGLEANDIPLLISVASTHTPEVTQRYGISFR